MAENYDDGEIYYDNMEIMESIEKLKNAKNKISPKPSHVSRTLSPTDKPPVLPPKKKNMAKSQMINQNATKSTSERPTPKSTPKSQIAISPQSTQKSPTSVASPKRVQVWNHPGLLRTRSIVEEPLAPIVEEEGTHDTSPLDSFVDLHISQESPLKDQSEYLVKDGAGSRTDGEAFTNSCRTASDSRDNMSGGSTSSGSESQMSQSRNAAAAKQTLKLSLDSKSDAGISYQDVEDDNAVKPYGMVDVGWVEKNVEATVTRSVTSQYMGLNGPSLHQNGAKEQGLGGKSHGLENSYSYNNGITLNTDEQGSSTSLSSLRELESLHIVGSGNSKKSFDSSRHSFDQDGSNGVCAYMSIPIHAQEHSKGAPGRMHQHPLHRVNANSAKMNAIDHKTYYKDDEYIYDEIQDYAKDDAMQKALTDIDKVLESIGNEDISRTSSLASKRFPIPPEKPNDDNAQYDNFSYRGNIDSRQIGSPWNAGNNPTPPMERMGRARTMLNQSRESSMAQPGIMRSGNTDIHSPTGAFSSYIPLACDAGRREDKRYDYFQSNNARSLPRLSGRNKFSVGQEENESGEREISESSGSSVPCKSGISDIQDNSSASESRDKSRQSLERIGGDSISRQSSKADIEGSSEGDSYSFSGLHGETLPGRLKSTGSALSSTENLKGNSRSLGRSNSCERKKSSFRSKFKFRSRSKSQERVYGESDSMGHLSGVSDVDDKKTDSRQRGSRLRRRLSRKRLENKESSERKSLEGYDAEVNRTRASTPVSFIRKLLRKSKNGDAEDASQSSRKLGPNSSGSEDSFSRTPSSGPNQSQTEIPRGKHLTSPPSRRARKILHPRQAREKAVLSDSSNSDSDRGTGNFRTGETLKRGDEYLEPCEPNYEVKDPGKDRGRKGISQRMKSSRGRRFEKDTEKSGVSSFHRDKYRALVSLNAQTLKKISEKWLTEWRNRLPVGGFLITSWADIVIASKRPQCILGRTVIYEAYFATNPGHRLACQIIDKRDVNQRLIKQLENCSTLIAHPNLCSVCSHFHCKIPGSLMYPPRDEAHSEALCVVLANVPATSLTTYIGRLREVKEQKQVHKQILLMVLQLLQALDTLSRSGFNLSYINADHLIVTQEMGLLQILPHVIDTDDMRTSSLGKPTIIQQISGLLSWMLQGCLDPVALSTHSGHSSTYLSSLKRISQVLTSSPHDFTVGSLQSLIQCAVWCPRSAADIDTTHESVLEALRAWIDVKQAELVSDIAVLFSAKSDFLPIYMFYKHQYFSKIDPKNLYQNLRVLGRI